MKNLILPLCLVITLISCKKKDDAPVPVPSPPPPPADSPLQSGVGLYANQLNGCLMISMARIPGSTVIIGAANALFSASNKPYSYYYKIEGGPVPEGLNAGQLLCNGTDLPFTPNGSGGFYYNYVDLSLGNKPAWKLSANSNFSSFESTISRGFPVAANIGNMPDSASKSTGLQINFNNNYSNADSLHVILMDSGTNHFLVRRLPGNATSLNIAGSEISNFTNGNGSIQVVATNYSNQVTGGKALIYVCQLSSLEDLVVY